MNPSKRAIALCLGWAFVGGLSVIWPELYVLGLGVAGVFATACLLDGFFLRMLPSCEVTRVMPTAMSLGSHATVTLRFKNTTQYKLQLEVFDHIPDGLQFEQLPGLVELSPESESKIEYTVLAMSRGQFVFQPAYIRQTSFLGLWQKHRRLGEPTSVKVYPDFRAVSHFGLMAIRNRLDTLGIHTKRRRGEGRDFHQLRDYRFGDSLRHIDWRATSRMQRTIAKEYTDESDQQVVFLLDHGRSMHSHDGVLTHLDHGLNAMLLLSWVALRQGDAVGLMTFGGQERWLAPRKGSAQLANMLHSTFDLQSSLEISDFHNATESLLKRLSRRTLVIVLTNLRDEPDTTLLKILRVMARKHLVLVASLRDEVLEETLREPCDSLSEAIRLSATHLYLNQRDALHRMLADSHLQLLDTEPKHLAGQLVNRYLDIKQAGTL